MPTFSVQSEDSIAVDSSAGTPLAVNRSPGGWSREEAQSFFFRFFLALAFETYTPAA